MRGGRYIVRAWIERMSGEVLPADSIPLGTVAFPHAWKFGLPPHVEVRR